MARSVEKAYGHALFLTGLEKGNMRVLLSDCETLCRVLKDTPEFSSFLLNPEITRGEKENQLTKIFSGKISEDILGLFRVILEKSRQENIPGILDFFISEAKEELKIGTVFVSTPTPLSELQKEKVEKKVLDTTKYESLEVTYQLDPSLLGGIVIRVNDRVVDSSVKYKLKSLESTLLKAKL